MASTSPTSSRPAPDSSESRRAAVPRRRVLVIHNPTAGWRKRARFGRLLNALVETGCLVEVMPTTQRGDAEAFARAARRAEWDVLAVAGGDGTINEVINGLGPDAPPLGILPMGTANVAAREIDVPFDVLGLARLVATAPPRAIHLGVANGRRFITMAGVGFDAHVVAAVDSRLKRWIGRGAYGVTIARLLFRHRFRRYGVTADGKSYEAASIVLANGHYYGGPFSCAPDARLDDPELHAVLFLWGGPWAVLWYLAGLGLGVLHRMPGIRIVRARRIDIAGGENEPVQADGDTITTLPLEAAVGGVTIQVLTTGA